MSLCERKLEILDSLLSSDHIQPIVIKLVSYTIIIIEGLNCVRVDIVRFDPFL